MPRNLFPGAASLGDVIRQLTRALQAGGYGDPGIFCMAGGGFALATQLERIGEDRRPLTAPTRWDSGPAGLLAGRDITLFNIVDALLHARPGRYRMIVFVIGPRAIVPRLQPMTFAQAGALASKGSPTLPWSADSYVFRPPQTVTALVYEFVHPRLGDPAVPVLNTVPVRQQLVTAGVLRTGPVRLAR